ncbi:MAG TPA: PAS domain-containing sensor histidine kinase, partial [Nitrolancea sp.]|nr:PAS domain-containing sensor histidine kinase [Nitrolancea sp.]
VHLWEDGTEALRGSRTPDIVIVFMYALFFVPVIYASLNFGRAGAIPTAIWTAILALPSILFFHHGSDRWAEVLQHLTIIALAAVIATRVDREIAARHEAEQEGQARRLSEVKYRALFASAHDAIVVFSESGYVEEANAAAAELLSQPGGIAPGTPLSALVGAEQAAYLSAFASSGEVGGEDLRLTPRPGIERWVEPVWSAVRVAGGRPAIQVVFHDVTERRSAQQGLEAYARQIVAAQEEERKRIARDLHDGSLQSVVLLCRQIDQVESHAGELFEGLRRATSELRRIEEAGQAARRHRLLDGAATERALTTERLATIEASVAATASALAGEIETVHRSAETIADELRGFSWSLRPSILDDLGLVPAVEWLVHDLEDRTGTRGDFEVTGVERRLPAALEPGLFRIAQEALHNVERHAAAREVRVRLDFDLAAIHLSVADNGSGFPVQEGHTTSSLTGKLGLRGMRERARLLGGTVHITSTAGRGTQVDVSVPLPGG